MATHNDLLDFVVGRRDLAGFNEEERRQFFKKEKRIRQCVQDPDKISEALSFDFKLFRPFKIKPIDVIDVMILQLADSYETGKGYFEIKLSPDFVGQFDRTNIRTGKPYTKEELKKLLAQTIAILDYYEEKGTRWGSASTKVACRINKYASTICEKTPSTSYRKLYAKPEMIMEVVREIANTTEGKEAEIYDYQRGPAVRRISMKVQELSAKLPKKFSVSSKSILNLAVCLIATDVLYRQNERLIDEVKDNKRSEKIENYDYSVAAADPIGENEIFTEVMKKLRDKVLLDIVSTTKTGLKQIEKIENALNTGTSLSDLLKESIEKGRRDEEEDRE